MALTQDSYFVSFETVKFYNWIVKYFFSDFNCYWRIALWGCLKTAVYGRGSIQRVGTLNISLLSPLAINVGCHAQFFSSVEFRQFSLHELVTKYSLI